MGSAEPCILCTYSISNQRISLNVASASFTISSVGTPNVGSYACRISYSTRFILSNAFPQSFSHCTELDSDRYANI